MKLSTFPKGSEIVGGFVVAPYTAMQDGTCEACSGEFRVNDSIFGLHEVVTEIVFTADGPKERTPDVNDFNEEVSAVFCSDDCAEHFISSAERYEGSL